MNALSIEFCTVPCENPFFLASSPVAAGYDLCARSLEAGFAGLFYKTISLFRPADVSPHLACVRNAYGQIVGLKNLEHISTHPYEENLEILRRLKQAFPQKVIACSIMGENASEWTQLALAATQAGADLIECNFSCPHTGDAHVGSDVGSDPQLVAAYTRAARQGSALPILAKMTPNVSAMAPVAQAAVRAGATGIAAINTVKCITQVDAQHRTCLPRIGEYSSVSGYSGNAIKPIALRFIHELASNPALCNVPLSGIGGIETWRDALDFLMLGCTNLQICTSIMQYGNRVIQPMLDGLSRYLEENACELQQIIGCAVPNIVDPIRLERGNIRLPRIDRERCIGCGRCYLSCRDGAVHAMAWEADSRTPHVETQRCIGCHLCTMVCPVDAISIEQTSQPTV